MVSLTVKGHVGTGAQSTRILESSDYAKTQAVVLTKPFIAFQSRRILHPHVKNISTALKSLLHKDVLKSRIQGILRETFKRETSLHGVLVSLHGTGMLILGESRTGKSGCALKVILDGGRLVSDDIVVIRRIPDGGLIGRSPARTKDLIEIRKLGIVNLRNLFGDSAVEEENPVHMVVELSWKGQDAGQELPAFIRILGVRLPVYRLAKGFPGGLDDAIKNLVSEFRRNAPASVQKKGIA
jgi:serine kinase of HPr protein (carbohydrate metabolism regulator)